MARKRGALENKPLAARSFSVEPVARSKAFLSFLEMRAWILALVMVILGSVRIVSTYNVFNHTVDEPAHIACGLEWLDTGTYAWEPQHPPLARIATAIGPYLLGVRSQYKGYLVKEGVRILSTGNHYDQTLFYSRLGTLPFFWVGCLVVYQWGKRYFNAAVATLALFAFSFEPTILAHAGLSTTDMALAAFLGAAFLTGLMWIEEPTVKHSVLFGVSGGLAIASKFSSLVFFPAVAGLALLCYFVIERPGPADVLRATRKRAGTLALSAGVAFVAIWAIYRFSFGPVPFTSLELPFPELYAGIRDVQHHNQGGHTSYLLGQRGHMGWWYFFPVVFLVKTPIGLLGLFGISLYMAARRSLGFARAWIPAAFVFGIFGVAMQSTINIGLRHILPVYLGISLLVAAAAYRILQRAPANRLAVAFLVVLVGWYAISSVASHPDYLPYFNELAGNHPENIVVDSDLDWGQDIKRLATRLKQVGAQEVYLSTFLYGEFEKDQGIPHRRDNMDLLNPPTGWVAIGYSPWKETRLGLPDSYSQYTLWPDRIPPLEKIGKSMLLWYFPPGTGR